MNTKTLIQAFFSTASLQLLGRVISIISGVILARLLGPENFGRYSFVMAIVAIAILPAIAGLPQLIIREVAIYRQNKAYNYLNGFLIWTKRYIYTLSFFSIVLLGAAVYLGSWDDNIGMLIVIAFVLIPLKALLARQGAIFNAFQFSSLAQLPINIVAPLFFLIILVATWFFGVDIKAEMAMAFQGVSHFLALFVCLALLSSYVDKHQKVSNELKFDTYQWKKSLLPLTMVMVITTLNNELATVFLGFLGDESEVGYFRVAMQASMLFLISLQSINAITAPQIARMYRAGNKDDAQLLLTRSVRLGCLFSLPLMLFLCFFSDELVILLFGNEFLPASNLIRLLLLGQVVNVCTGSAGMVLNMTGNEKYTLKVQILSVAILIAMLSILVPLYGAVGAAVSVSTSVAMWNVMMSHMASKRTNLTTWLK
ncbi:flippase [Vibrio astriarenae]